MAPGVKQQAWSFDGKVPGTALRGKVGDLFTITLVNEPRNKLGHSIDFHASKVAWNDEMRTINPGERLVYQFKAKHAGIYLYHATQYKFRPIRVAPRQRVRVWVLDAGPSENSAFHIVGTIFDTTYKEGEYLLQPGFGRGGSQVLDLQPAQGGFVEFSFDEPGLYPIVTHKFANVAKGALGLFQAGDVKATGGGH